MGFLEDFWENINAGATTIATAPDPVINIVNAGGNTQNQGRPTTTTTGGNKPANSTRSDQQIYDLIESYHGDDISRHDTQLIKMGSDMTTMGEHQTKIGKAVVRLDAEDIILHDKHIDQEGRISENAQAIATHGHDYAGIDHTHNGGGGDCEFWDLGCHFGKSMEGLGKLALIGVVAFFIFMLIKKRLGL